MVRKTPDKPRTSPASLLYTYVERLFLSSPPHRGHSSYDFFLSLHIAIVEIVAANDASGSQSHSGAPQLVHRLRVVDDPHDAVDTQCGVNRVADGLEVTAVDVANAFVGTVGPCEYVSPATPLGCL